MNVGEIKYRVKKQFGDFSGVQITDTDIVNWINDGQTHISRQTECLQNLLRTDVVSGQNDYVLPSGYIKIRRVTFEGILLKAVTLEEIDDINPGRDAAPVGGRNKPQVYYVWGNNLNLYPTPADAVTLGLEIYYIRQPILVNVDTDVPEIPIHWHEDLVLYALSRAKETDEEDASAQRVMVELEARMLHSREEFNSATSDSYPAVRLTAGDDW